MKVKGSRPGETNYLIPISNGLLCSEHRKRIGVAIWEFFWCIDHTTEEVNGLGKVLGEKPITYAYIAADLGVSQKTVERHCKRLEMEGYIHLIRTPYGFQIQVAKSKKFFAKRVDRSVGSEGESRQKCLRDKARVSERVDRSVGSNKTIQDNTKDSIAHLGFARFWEKYPRKIAKRAALKAFGKINPDERLVEVILKAVNRQRDTGEWKRDEGQYIPHAVTWLNGRRWEDELKNSLAPGRELTQADHYRNLKGKRREQTQPTA